MIKPGQLGLASLINPDGIGAKTRPVLVLA